MRRTLSVLLEGGLGLVEGEAWWMDDKTVVFWCPEVLDAGRTYSARVDLGLRGNTVDILCEITHLWPREEVRISRGFVLSADYSLRHPSDAEPLHERLAQINPEFTAPASAPPPRSSEPVRGPAQTAPSTGRAATAPADSGDPTIMLSPGRTPSLLIQFHSKSVAAKSICIDDQPPYVLIPAVGDLASGDLVLAVLQLPSGVYIQTSAEVERVAGQRLKLKLSSLSPQQIGQLGKSTRAS